MKNIITAVVILLVAGGAFFLGRSTSETGDKNTDSAEVQAPVKAATPTKAPANKAAKRPAQAAPAQVQTFPVSPMAKKTVPRKIEIPEDTKPADDASASHGPKSAPVVVMEISDFQCPVCKRAHDGLKKITTDFPDQVRYVFKHNPLEMHRRALDAAAGSMAAARQDKFWEYADELFANQRALSEEDLMDVAKRLNLDMKRFRKDYEDPTLRQRAKLEGKTAADLGARGTPAFLINGKLQVGWASYAAIRQMAQRELDAMNNLTAGGMSVSEARKQRVRKFMPEKAKELLKSPLGIEFSEQ